MSMMAHNPIRWTALAGLIVILLPGVVHAAQETTAAAQAAPEAPPLENQNDKLSYALGIDFANQLRSYSVVIDLDLLVRGLKDARSGGKSLLTEEEVRAVLNDLRSGLRKKQLALQDEKLLKIKNEGEAFLAENKAKEGVVTLESGLQYKVLKTGNGRKPTIEDTVVCHFRGTQIDGTEFANSYKSKGPATFAVKRVIKGWSEALRLMPVGSKWQLFIPSHLAYGERGVSRRVGPNATVIFEVELISIKDREAPAHRVGSEAPPAKAVPALAAIVLAFKLDPRLTKGLYMGDRWVSPPTYVTTAEGKTGVVEARAHGRDARGKTLKISPTWTASDPEMVTVIPNEGDAVTITVRRAGESRVRVTSQGVTKDLTIKAADQGNVIQVEIAQKP